VKNIQKTLLQKRKKEWARAYFAAIFDEDTFTTSRIESWNSVLKWYLNSRSKISALCHFIKGTERCYFARDLKINPDACKLLEFESLIRD